MLILCELIHWACVVDAMVCGKGRYTLVKDVDDVENGAYDKPLPCFGCGIGWFSWVESFVLFLVLTVKSPVLFTWWYLSLYSFLLGFVFPLLWYYATFLYFGNYYRKDPRERAGLAASAITVMTLSLSLGSWPFELPTKWWWDLVMLQAMGFSLLLLVIAVFRWF